MCECRLVRSGVFLTSFVRVKRQCKARFGTRQKRRKLSLLSDNPNGELFRHLMGNFSLGESEIPRVCNHRTKGPHSCPDLAPSALCIWPSPSYRKHNEHLLNKSRRYGTRQQQTDFNGAGEGGRGRGGSHNADRVSYWSVKQEYKGAIGVWLKDRCTKSLKALRK